MPEPELFTGPLIPDAGKAAGTGIALGGVVGFVAASLRYPLREFQTIIAFATYSGLLAGVFGTTLVVWARVL